MTNERTVVKGIVLREKQSKESDKILTVLTAELGKITVVAKGACSRRSKVGASTQLMAYSELVLSEKHGWQYLMESSTIELFDGIRQDIELLSLGSYFAEIVEWVSGDTTESSAILSLLLNTLYALGTLHRPQLLVKAAFELKLMSLIGFEPLFDGCSICGIQEPDKPVFDLLGGTLCCRTCAGTAHTLPLTQGALQSIRHVLYGNPKRLYSFQLEAADLACFSLVTERYTRAMLDREFHTLHFYKSLCSYETTQNKKL